MPLESLKYCPICQNTHFEPYLVCRDYTVSQEQFNIVACKACGFLFTNPRPAKTDIDTYYRSEKYISHSDTQKGLVNRLYHLVRKQALQNKRKLIAKYQPLQGHLLDVGCGTGYFLEVCHKAGWKTAGTEPDEKARRFAQKRNPQTTIKEEITDQYFDNATFDCITMWHVLEHIHDLPQTLNRLHQLLKPKGKLIMAVPNAQSPDSQWFKEYWAAYDVPRHLYHFKPQDLKKLLTKYSFQFVAQQTMPFDAYYIALLSNQYKTGKMQYIKSFWRGWWANFKGKNNTSSMIYVFEK